MSQLKAKAATMAAVDRGGKKPVPARQPARAVKVASGGGGFAFAMDEVSDERDADFQR